MNKLPLVLGIGFICLVVGMAISSVGTVPECNNVPYTAQLPITVLFLMFVPMICGYLAGRGE